MRLNLGSWNPRTLCHSSNFTSGNSNWQQKCKGRAHMRLLVTTSKLELKLLPEVKLELWHSVRGNFRNLNLNALNYRVECLFRIWQVYFTSQVFPSSYKQLSISDHKNSPNFSIILNLSSTGCHAGSRCAANERLAFACVLTTSRNSIIQ